MSLSADDLDRLRYASGGGAIDPARSLFGPRSVLWRVDREAIVLLGGGRALLLQVAHPLVAAGVVRHSDFRAHPLRRLWRTLDLVLTAVFGDATQAIRAVREIERVHARVHGVLAADVGPFPRGTRYSAGHPDLLLWVHATLVDTALLTYERFFGPLGPEERAAYYAESRRIGRLLGIPHDRIPPTLPAFEEYLAGMLASATLTVGPAARDIAASILRPSVPAPLRPLLAVGRLVTVGLLPTAVRAQYGFGWGPGREALLQLVAALSRAVVPRLPACVRVVPHARRAGKRAEERRTRMVLTPTPA